MKWLITGGCGFLGTSLIKELSKNSEHSFRILDNLSVGTKEDLIEVITFDEVTRDNITDLKKGQCQLVVGDIRDEQICLNTAKKMDVIIHFAANTGVPDSVNNPRLDMESNVIGTFNILEAARTNQVKRFVFASSGAPAGEVEPPIHEELPPHPVSPYGASKLAGEGYCSAYYKTFKIDTISLRFGNVYGPRSKHKSSVVAKFIKHALQGNSVEIYGDGSQTRDFIYIDDLVDAVVKAGTISDIGGETFQIATKKETTLNELVDIMRPILEDRGIILDVLYSEKRIGDVMRNYSDTSKAERNLQWKAQTGLEEGIEHTLNWFIKNRK